MLLATFTAFTIDVVQRKVEHPLRLILRRPALTGALAGLAIVSVIVFSGGTTVPFIYFQF